ncbi:MAG TPA: type II toxin-antitoxin system RelE/ParE family toxin [Devosia sp.]|nr:type II toxin-antitoxin system RelE/ParE family toxin [Devosia sp.]
MPRAIRVSEQALRWLAREAERIAEDFGLSAAKEFQTRIDNTLQQIAEFPAMAERGKIPGTRTFVVNRRTILTIVERDGYLVVAAARSHRQDEDGRR